MADQDRVEPWFPELPAASGPSVRAPRPAGRAVGDTARRSPGRRPGDDLAECPRAGRAAPEPGLAAPAGGTSGGLPDPGSGLGDAAGTFLPAVQAAPRAPAAPPADAPSEWSQRAPADRLDPRLAARQFSALVADADRARDARDAVVRAGREDALARADRCRDTAGEVRDRVGTVWRQVAETLAPFGVTDLSQVRDQLPAADADSVEAFPGVGLADEPPAGARRPALGRDRRRTPADLSRRRRRGDAGGGATAAVSGAGEVDVAAELAEARQLCMRALASSAELRGVLKGPSSLSVGLVTAGACALVAVAVAVGRVFFHSTGLPCVLAALLVGGAVVTVGTEGGGAKAAVRSALLAAGTAGAVVLGTLRVAPVEPVGIIASLLALAAAIRFGLGFGAGTKGQEKPAARGPAGKRR
jgi:hypothetical protein